MLLTAIARANVSISSAAKLTASFVDFALRAFSSSLVYSLIYESEKERYISFWDYELYQGLRARVLLLLLQLPRRSFYSLSTGHICNELYFDFFFHHRIVSLIFVKFVVRSLDFFFVAIYFLRFIILIREDIVNRE